MIMFFEYNWQVREEWFKWSEECSPEELARTREGGLGSILRTLVHVVDIEQAWINGLQGIPEFHYNFEDYLTLDKVRDLSRSCRLEVEPFVRNWSEELKDRKFDIFTFGEVMHHVIAHEIHHIGQLSVWSREMGRKPVSANLIFRGLAHS